MMQFEALRKANATRQEEWDSDGQLTGNLGMLYRSNELGGEVGEAQNAIKKLVREALGIRGSRSSVAALAEELADIIICVDLLAEDVGIDLAQAVQEKFNKTSVERGLKTMLYMPTGY